MKNFINKILFSISLVFAFTIAQAQVGLEGVVVEKYYIANAADNAAIPTLPVGATTYRVYIDLAAGWEFQALYGEPAPQHFLKFNSTTPFLNFSGGKFRAYLVDNTALGTGGLALDSWLTVGAANDAEEGVLKTEDDGSNNLLSTHPQLNNSGGAMGIGLKTQDGMILTPGIQDATIVGLTAAQQTASMFMASGVSSFQDDDFAISTTGTVGTGPGNKVLIGQFTTAGDFGFELNVQIRNATTFAVEKWVATNAQPGEFTHAQLTRVPNTAPTVTLDQPAANANVVVGTVIPLAATANDAAPGTVTLVEFLLDGTTVISSDNSAPYEGSWTSISGCHTITARATDNEGAQTTSTPAITICAGANQPPTITVSAPSNAIVGDNVNITSVVGDVDGSVTQVEFFVDNVSIGVDNTPPTFSFNWTAVLGIHSIKGVASDNIGATTTSNVVSINVAANTPPTASITAPANGASYTHPAVVTIDATATDIDGTITNVEFLVNNVVVGSDNSFPYSFNWNSVIGIASLTVRSTDDKGAQTTSSAVVIEIADPLALPYKVVNTTANCLSNTFNVPFAAVAAVDNIIGYDVVMEYDDTKVTPTGIVTVRNAVVDSLIVDVVNSIDYVNSRVNISVFFNSSAPANSEFFGTGVIFDVEFFKTANFDFVDTAEFCISSLQESRITGVTQKLASCGKYITYKDSLFTASLRFWADNSPILYNTALPNDYLVTNIYGNNSSCNAPAAVAVQPNLTGNFTHDITDGLYVDIRRDVLATTSVQPIVNGYDALLIRKLLVNDPAFVPTIYQVIAMDVNTDGVISAGDLSQVNQRAVLMIPEFRQAWNYDANGVSNGQLSKDWLFVDATRVANFPTYKISSTFPLDNGVGFSKYRVPVVPFCLPVTVTDVIDCPLISPETYKGIALGDVNGNYQSIAPDGLLRSNDKLIFDLSRAVVNGTTVDIPVSIKSYDPVYALDFSMQFNNDKLAYNAIINHTGDLQTLDHFNTTDRTLRFTSNRLQEYQSGAPVVSVRFDLKNGQVTANDLRSISGYFNGEEVNVEVRINSDKTTTYSDFNAEIYPNPTNGIVYVVVEEDATVQLFDLSSRQIVSQTDVKANERKEFNINQFANGMYLMKIFNNNSITTKKIVINK